ncbi:MAG: methyltransferase domain-containing protein, partial [Dehalococcoidales bacterium]|nr:methyltransferase domain-containing protein [Dehalococcoidales bacterium]
VALAQNNLKTSGVVGTILHQDIFQTSFQEESFDIVYSMGLIEHFADPNRIIEAHIKLLKKGGTLIITVPNLKGSLSHALNKMMGKEKTLLATHNLEIMDKNSLHHLLRNRGVDILKLDYFGPVDLTAAFSGIRTRPVLYMAHLLNQVIGYATFFMPGSSYFSPYLVFIGKKEECELCG